MYQELDVTFTDGRALYVVECKAGGVNSDQVMKLQNIVRYFGGVSGHGFLNCCFLPKNKVILKKIKESYNIDEVTGDSLMEKIRSIISGNKGASKDE